MICLQNLRYRADIRAVLNSLSLPKNTVLHIKEIIPKKRDPLMQEDMARSGSKQAKRIWRRILSVYDVKMRADIQRLRSWIILFRTEAIKFCSGISPTGSHFANAVMIKKLLMKIEFRCIITEIKKVGGGSKSLK